MRSVPAELVLLAAAGLEIAGLMAAEAVEVGLAIELDFDSVVGMQRLPGLGLEPELVDGPAVAVAADEQFGLVAYFVFVEGSFALVVLADYSRHGFEHSVASPFVASFVVDASRRILVWCS